MTGEPIQKPEETEHSLPPVIRSARVEQSVEVAFEMFTTDIGAWWPLPTHGIFGERAGGVAFINSKLVEIATDGQTAVWGEILAWEPPSRLVISWHPGREAADGSEVEVSFAGVDSGTLVTIEHRGWERFGSDGRARRRSYAGPNAWGYVLDHFADGAETPSDGPDLTTLAAAYETFFDEALQGNFGAPEPGQWTAEQVVAHVALNDRSMLAVSQSLIHEDPIAFVNDVPQAPESLDRWIETHRTLDDLVVAGRLASRQFMATLARLSPEQLDRPVHCTLSSDGEVRLDDKRPWRSIAIEIQGGMHLPSHTDQLRSLRP